MSGKKVKYLIILIEFATICCSLFFSDSKENYCFHLGEIENEVEDTFSFINFLVIPMIIYLYLIMITLVIDRKNLKQVLHSVPIQTLFMVYHRDLYLGLCCLTQIFVICFLRTIVQTLQTLLTIPHLMGVDLHLMKS